MRKILTLVAFVALSGLAMAQQFSLPILPEKMWPSDYAKYETDVLKCCNYILTADPSFNKPKHQECTSFLLRWLAGAPQVRVVVTPEITPIKQEQLLVVYLAAWTRHALQYKDAEPIVCANVAVGEMLSYYQSFGKTVGKSKLCDRLLKQQKDGSLPATVAKAVAE